ncbi:hypothetical protein BCR44DRAFT_1202577 [Catenaria anguillulae PL171]|uniref:Uncharacterized protein n=1 Tax=Catenaria anguillulae PL171 TaxID=765915 RepID=A0A1Y2HFP2_9FUNG|nr:hypothetical protein BCR44DRAFT_1202577 [Catenaria anguillulae PL171]
MSGSSSGAGAGGKRDGADFSPAPIPLTHSSSLPLASSSSTLLPAAASTTSHGSGSGLAPQSQSTKLAPIPLFRAPSHDASDPGGQPLPLPSDTRRSSASSTHATAGGGTGKRRNLLQPPSWSASRSRSRRSSPRSTPAAPPSTGGSSVANATDLSATDLISPDAEYFDVISRRDLPDTFAPSRLKSLATLARVNKTWTDAELQAEVERDLRKPLSLSSSSPAPSMRQAAATLLPQWSAERHRGRPACQLRGCLREVRLRCIWACRHPSPDRRATSPSRNARIGHIRLPA